VSVPPPDRSQAASLKSFGAAQRRAFMQDILADLSGRSGNLLSFEQVQQQLRLDEPAEQIRLEEIPLDKIVGSVGRYRDFNRAFLPRAQIDPQRWARIDRLRRQASLPAIEVFQVSDVYFVRDGNHRVSVARTRGDRTIWARVAEIPVRVPLGPDTSPADLILKAAYAEFLEKTSLDRSVPDQSIELTRADGYRSILQHIEVHQFYLGLRSRHYPTLPEAAANWYQAVYLPVVEHIRASGIMHRFPGRTEADLYLWIAENRAQLQMRYGSGDLAQEAVDEFAQKHYVTRFRRRLRQWRYRLFPRRPSPPPERRPPRTPAGK
jgi:hypothetical protein